MAEALFQIIRIVVCIVRWIWMVVNHFYVMIAYFGWILLFLPFKTWLPSLYWHVEGHLYQRVLWIISSWIHLTPGFSIYLHGENLEPLTDTTCLAIGNHQNSMDIPAVLDIFSSFSDGCKNMAWVEDIMFKYTQFGWISQSHGDYFIRQGKDTRQSELDKFGEYLRTVFWRRDRRWLILFPEGGFLCNRKESSQRYAQKYGHPVLQHCTLPRLGAIEVALDAIGPHAPPPTSPTVNGTKPKHFSHLIDITLAYPGGIAFGVPYVIGNLWEPKNVHVHLRTYRIEDIPKDSEGRLSWVYKRFEEKEAMLSRFYREGTFTADDTALGYRVAGAPGLLPHLAVHGFWVLASILLWVVCKRFFGIFF